MPYIKPSDRKKYEAELDNLCYVLEDEKYSSGHVTYVLYKIMIKWWLHKPCYNTIALIRGCLIGTKAEFDRRVAAPYEDDKIGDNGDVHE